MNLQRFPLFLLIPLFTLLVACTPKGDEGQVEEHQAVKKFKKFQEMGYLQAFTLADLDIDQANPVMDLLVKEGTLVSYVWDSTLMPHRQIELQLQGVWPLLQEVDFQIDTLKMRIDEVELSEPGDEMEFIQLDTFVEVSVLVKGRRYREDIYYSKLYAKHSPYLLINRGLADAEYPKRLFTVDWRCKDCDSWSTIEGMSQDLARTGALLLSEKEAGIIMDHELLPMPWGEFLILKTSEVEQYIKMMDDLGLFDQEDADVLARRKMEVTRERFYHGNEIFFFFTSPTYTLDVHNIEREDPYGDHIRELGEALPIEFNPEKVVAQYGEEKTELSFNWNGQNYRTTLTEAEGWLDVRFLGLVNDALEDQEAGGKLWAIDQWGQEIDLIYLQDEVYKEVEANKLLDLIPPETSDAAYEGRYFEEEQKREYP